MLSDSEQRSWDEIERTWTEDSRGGNGIRALAVGAAGIAIMFTMTGTPWAALAVLAVPVLAWALSRYWRDIGTGWAASFVPMDGWVEQREEPQRTPKPPKG